MLRRNKDLINTVRGTLKAFGIRTGGGKNTLFARRVREAINDKMILTMTEPLLVAYENGLRTLAKLDEMAPAIAKKDAICRRLMTVPGVGPVVALTFRTGVAFPVDGGTVVNIPNVTGTPVITSFSNDSGKVGDGITNNNTLTIRCGAATQLQSAPPLALARRPTMH